MPRARGGLDVDQRLGKINKYAVYHLLGPQHYIPDNHAEICVIILEMYRRAIEQVPYPRLQCENFFFLFLEVLVPDNHAVMCVLQHIRNVS